MRESEMRRRNAANFELPNESSDRRYFGATEIVCARSVAIPVSIL